MSYTVLAVKWRPKRFSELVGQPHVVQALENSLANERLHHAYLFSGTRGVGKTTIARILAKALNCSKGVVAEPCGECEACTAIDEGRFVDLIEVDAASRTRVDDTRELLDNVQYAPTHGRYKVYLIDEVHMLSNHSFNALLKTLEEPPPHVKFLLATTDPQKLPVTVLSRCLQFHLKKLTKKQIVDQLQMICDAEKVACESDGLQAIARAADGSVRDALSLLDQSIAFGGGKVEAAKVHAMLGTIDRDHVEKILTALAEQDGAGLVNECDRLDELAADFGLALDELMRSLQQIAVIQLVDGKQLEEDHEVLAPFADKLSPEDVQLYYQMALNGRRDLAYCRDLRMGFEMTLLRMLAFRPAAASASTGNAKTVTARPSSRSASATSRGQTTSSKSNAQPAPAAGASKRRQARSADAAKAHPQSDSVAKEASKIQVLSSTVAPVEDSPRQQTTAKASADSHHLQAAGPEVVDNEVVDNKGTIDDWGALLVAADLRGVARQLADNCEIENATTSRLDLILSRDREHLLTEQLRKRIEDVLSEHLGNTLRVSIEAGKPPRETPAQLRVANENERMRQARESVEQDARVRAMEDAFDAVVEQDSIQPLDE